MQIQLERRKVLMLQQQMEQLKNKLGQTRTNMGGIFSAKEKTVGLQKQIKIMENRLEKQFVKYNEVCRMQVLSTCCFNTPTENTNSISPAAGKWTKQHGWLAHHTLPQLCHSTTCRHYRSNPMKGHTPPYVYLVLCFAVYHIQQAAA